MPSRYTVDKCPLLVNQSKQSTFCIKCVIASVMLRLVDLSLMYCIVLDP